MKAHFHRLTLHQNGDDTFDLCARNIAQECRTPGYYLDCDGVFLRIERYHRTADYCTGDIIRQQREDIPPSAPIGAELSPNTTPQGHRTAFLYHYDTSTLVLQVNKNGVTIGTVLRCITQHLGHGGFGQFPVISKDSIEDLVNGNPRSLTVKFAAPQDLAIAEGPNNSDLANLDNMRRLFNAPSIEVTCGFDTPKKGSLDNNAVRNFLRSVLRAPVTPTKIQVKQEGEAELLDLLGKKLTYSDDTVNLDSANINGHYAVRKRVLETAFADNSAYIVQYYRNAA